MTKENFKQQLDSIYMKDGVIKINNTTIKSGYDEYFREWYFYVNDGIEEIPYCYIDSYGTILYEAVIILIYDEYFNKKNLRLN